MGFAYQGCKVVVGDIDVAALDKTIEEIREAGGEAIGVQVDVSDSASTKNMVQQAVKKYSEINILINNASLMSVLPRRPWYEIPVEEWDNFKFERNVSLFPGSIPLYGRMIQFFAWKISGSFLDSLKPTSTAYGTT